MLFALNCLCLSTLHTFSYWTLREMLIFCQLFACSLREEPSQSSSLLQRMVVLPANESFQEFTSTAVRIAPALSSVAGITTTTAHSVRTFGKALKISLPHLVKKIGRAS